MLIVIDQFWVTTTSTSLSCFKTKTNHHFLLTGNIDSVINVFVYYMYYIVGCSQTSNQSHCRSLGIFFKISLKICILFSQMLNDKMFCVRKKQIWIWKFPLPRIKAFIKGLVPNILSDTSTRFTVLRSPDRVKSDNCLKDKWGFKFMKRTVKHKFDEKSLFNFRVIKCDMALMYTSCKRVECK